MPTLAYITSSPDSASDYISVIDTATNTLINTIALPALPIMIAVTPDCKFAYVTTPTLHPAAVSVVDLLSNMLVTTVAVGQTPYGLAITPDGKYVYVVNAFSNNVSVIDTSSNTVITTIPLGNQPLRVAITPDGKYAYVTSSFTNSVEVIDIATNMITASIPVSAPKWISITPDSKFAYVSGIGVDVIEIDTNTVIDNIALPFSVEASTVTPSGNFVYVANDYEKTVTVIATATNTILDTISVVDAYNLAITPDGKSVYVTSGDNLGISVIDTVTNTVSAVLPVDSNMGIAICSSTQPMPELIIQKTVSPDPAKTNQQIQYTIHVSNTGTLTANNVVLNDTLPVEVQYVSSSSTKGSCEYNGAVICDIGTIDVDETVTITILVKPLQAGTICNKVVVSDDTGTYEQEVCSLVLQIDPRQQAITDFISSVALEQTGLSHILNAEGKKIQKVADISATGQQMLDVNKSVEQMVNSVARLELILQSKLDLFSYCLCSDGACIPITDTQISEDFVDTNVYVTKFNNTDFQITNTGVLGDYSFIISSTPFGEPVVFNTVPYGVTTFENTFAIDFSLTSYGSFEFTVGSSNCILNVTVNYITVGG